MEEIGPSPINSGLQPVTAPDTIAAIGLREWDFANSSLQINEKTAPSVSGDDVAAVTEPPSINAGFSFDIDWRLESGLTQSSCDISPPAELMVTNSSEKYPSEVAFTAFRCEFRANSSCSSLVLLYVELLLLIT